MPGNFCPRSGKACPPGSWPRLRPWQRLALKINQIGENTGVAHDSLSLPSKAAFAVGEKVMMWRMTGLDRLVLRAALGAAAVAAICAMPSLAPSANAASRIKDLANVEGVRENQLIGYGLVVGLNGTGATTNNPPFPRQSITAMLERMGVNIRGQTL